MEEFAGVGKNMKVENHGRRGGLGVVNVFCFFFVYFSHPGPPTKSFDFHRQNIDLLATTSESGKFGKNNRVL